MEVRNLIKTDAQVVAIATIRVNDVYKRLVTRSYADPKIVLGVVTEILNNGEQATIVALEFVPAAYSTNIEAQVKVFPEDSEMALFPATVEEYLVALGDAIQVQHEVVSKANADLMAKKSVLDKMLTLKHKAEFEAATTREIGA